MNQKYLEATLMLDYHTQSIQKLIKARNWTHLPNYECIKAIYNFVRDEILFGYNVDDSIPTSKVLKDGYRTIDIMSEGKTQIGTVRMGDEIAANI